MSSRLGNLVDLVFRHRHDWQWMNLDLSPETIARELGALAAEQVGPERGELTKLAADIRTGERYMASLMQIARARMSEIGEAVTSEVPQ